MSRVLYTVWHEVDPMVESDWCKWMSATHIPAVVRRGGFEKATQYRVLEGSPSKYVTFYEAKDIATLKKYLDGPAKELREDYNRRFGSKSRNTRVIIEEASVT